MPRLSIFNYRLTLYHTFGGLSSYFIDDLRLLCFFTKEKGLRTVLFVNYFFKDSINKCMRRTASFKFSTDEA